MMLEKIHSYELKKQLLQQVDGTGPFTLPITLFEKRWLKSMLDKNEIGLFLTDKTVVKIKSLLSTYPDYDSSVLLEKGKAKPVFREESIEGIHRTLRQGISHKKAFVISYQLKNGERIEGAEGFPYKLEYYVQKQQWYILWVEKNHVNPYLISTPLHNIENVVIQDLEEQDYKQYQGKAKKLIQGQKKCATIVMNTKAFQAHAFEEEKHRIFYAFSCFDKEIVYDKADNFYEIRVYYRETEQYNLLQKIRMLGKKIIVQEPEELRTAMKQSAINALERYSKNS